MIRMKTLPPLPPLTPNSLWKNFVGTPEFHWSARLGQARSVWLSGLSGLFSLSRLFG